MKSYELTENKKYIVIVSDDYIIFDVLNDNINYLTKASDISVDINKQISAKNDIISKKYNNISYTSQIENNGTSSQNNDTNCSIIEIINLNSLQPVDDVDNTITDNLAKIDLLIIDKKINKNILPFYRINSIINLSKFSIINNEISLHKPIKLQQFLWLISYIVQDKNLFCCINKNWIYNQNLAKINSSDTEILLTDKENSIFSELLTRKNFASSKQTLKDKIWNYHQNSETMTIETHLYKLKQKLPKDLLEIKNPQCCLNIDSLF